MLWIVHSGCVLQQNGLIYSLAISIPTIFPKVLPTLLRFSRSEFIWGAVSDFFWLFHFFLWLRFYSRKILKLDPQIQIGCWIGFANVSNGWISSARNAFGFIFTHFFSTAAFFSPLVCLLGGMSVRWGRTVQRRNHNCVSAFTVWIWLALWILSAYFLSPKCNTRSSLYDTLTIRMSHVVNQPAQPSPPHLSGCVRCLVFVMAPKLSCANCSSSGDDTALSTRTYSAFDLSTPTQEKYWRTLRGFEA